MPTSRTCVITGCSSGFGRVTTTHLLSKGWRVLATVRAETDRDSLIAAASASGSGSLLTVAIADITRPEDVAALAATVSTWSPSVDALVNNAGTAYPGPLELLPLEEFRAQLEINVVAHLAVTQALLPSLKQARGTIINVSSVAGRIATPLLGAYGASKFALEALSDVLRIELEPFGVRVVVIEPSSSPTAIFTTSAARPSRAAERGDASPYAALIAKARAQATRSATVGFPPRLFAETVEEILADANPRPRYVIPAAARRRLLFRRFISDRMMDRLIRRAIAKMAG